MGHDTVATPEIGFEERMAKIEGAFIQLDQRRCRVKTEFVELRRDYN